MLKRARRLKELRGLLSRNRIVAIMGARQVGKTTLARQPVAGGGWKTTFFDLESPEDLARLADSMLALRNLSGLIVIDEIQRRPDLFPTLRVLVDRARWNGRFLILGSTSPDLLRKSSESLAGRITYYELGGFSLDEVGARRSGRLWLRGSFPRSFLAGSEPYAHEWRRDFIQAFLERDLPQLGVTVPAVTLRRFWSMLAHYHGQIWNSSEFARSFGVADTTVRRYLDLLSATFVVRQLQRGHENLAKRQVKAPRIYVVDSGLLHTLLNVVNFADLESHPKVGASWEGFALLQVIEHLGARPEECYSWRTHAGAELDLLIVRGRRRLGFEFKRSVSPIITPSMKTALTDLNLDRLDVIYAGERTFLLAPRIRAIPLSRLLSELDPLR